MTENEHAVMAILFASGDPVEPDRIAEAMGVDAAEVKKLLSSLSVRLDAENGALKLLKLDDSYQLTTRERFTPLIKKTMAQRRSQPLSQAALEVLATVAYNQPVTRAYVEQVRGVDSSSIVSSLVEKGLLEEAGRLELPGRPITYKTTLNFLRTFGLSSIEDLPMRRGTDVETDEDDGQLSLDILGEEP